MIDFVTQHDLVCIRDFDYGPLNSAAQNQMGCVSYKERYFRDTYMQYPPIERPWVSSNDSWHMIQHFELQVGVRYEHGTNYCEIGVVTKVNSKTTYAKSFSIVLH